MTLEELQQQVLTQQEQITQLQTERDTLQGDYDKLKMHNQELFLRVTNPAPTQPEVEKPKPLEDVALSYYKGSEE